jgi:uncharacterized protein YihD (DUF1040 family)
LDEDGRMYAVTKVEASKEFATDLQYTVVILAPADKSIPAHDLVEVSKAIKFWNEEGWDNITDTVESDCSDEEDDETIMQTLAKETEGFDPDLDDSSELYLTYVAIAETQGHKPMTLEEFKDAFAKVSLCDAYESSNEVNEYTFLNKQIKELSNQNQEMQEITDNIVKFIKENTQLRDAVVMAIRADMYPSFDTDEDTFNKLLLKYLPSAASNLPVLNSTQANHEEELTAQIQSMKKTRNKLCKFIKNTPPLLKSINEVITIKNPMITSFDEETLDDFILHYLPEGYNRLYVEKSLNDKKADRWLQQSVDALKAKLKFHAKNNPDKYVELVDALRACTFIDNEEDIPYCAIEYFPDVVMRLLKHEKDAKEEAESAKKETQHKIYNWDNVNEFIEALVDDIYKTGNEKSLEINRIINDMMKETGKPIEYPSDSTPMLYFIETHLFEVIVRCKDELLNLIRDIEQKEGRYHNAAYALINNLRSYVDYNELIVREQSYVQSHAEEIKGMYGFNPTESQDFLIMATVIHSIPEVNRALYLIDKHQITS